MSRSPKLYDFCHYNVIEMAALGCGVLLTASLAQPV